MVCDGICVYFAGGYGRVVEGRKRFIFIDVDGYISYLSCPGCIDCNCVGEYRWQLVVVSEHVEDVGRL